MTSWLRRRAIVNDRSECGSQMVHDPHRWVWLRLIPRKCGGLTSGAATLIRLRKNRFSKS